MYMAIKFNISMIGVTHSLSSLSNGSLFRKVYLTVTTACIFYVSQLWENY